MTLFRSLTESEEREFRQWARDNYKKFHPIEGIWHPVVQDECVKINANASTQIFTSQSNQQQKGKQSE